MKFTKRQVEIIEGAINLIDQGGIQNLTTKNLAAHMSFTEPALYRHFTNKTEILNSVLIYYQAILKSGMERSNEAMSGLKQILDIIQFQFEKFNANPAIIMVIFSETSFQNDSILVKTVTQIMEQKEKRIKTIISIGQNDKSIRKDLDCNSLANIVMGAMRFTALRWKLSGFKSDLLQESKMLQQTISTMIKSTL